MPQNPDGQTVKKIPVILVAAGRGSRAGGDIPKQYQPVCGRPLIAWTINALQKSELVGEIYCVINPDDADLFDHATKGFTLPAPIMGGDSRQQSALNGLKTITSNPSPYIMIHDAARPFVQPSIIADMVNTVTKKPSIKGAIPGVAVTDTVKRTNAQATIIETVSRDQLYRVQTPQLFDHKALLSAYENLDITHLTDDAMIMEAAGADISITKGDEGNMKVTNPEDFMKAAAMIQKNLDDIRTGHGFDVHAFDAGDHVTLCGVNIPHSHSLKGHSDADVAMHALTDALFSSIAAGDIGSHFPPSDDQWKGAKSEIFLKKACDLIADKGGMISNMVVTMMCEKPKIGAHRDAMRASLSKITGVSMDRISVQATTTEKLGFTGREEGIAAEAVATVRLPLEGM